MHVPDLLAYIILRWFYGRVYMHRCAGGVRPDLCVMDSLGNYVPQAGRGDPIVDRAGCAYGSPALPMASGNGAGVLPIAGAGGGNTGQPMACRSWNRNRLPRGTDPPAGIGVEQN